MLVLNKVKELVSVQFNLAEEDLDEDTSFMDDLHADSIDLVHLAMTLEDEYEIELEDEDIENIKTIGDTVDYIENKLE